MTGTSFIFLEIRDPGVDGFLRNMQRVLSGAEPRGPVHLTLRGPYEHRIDPIRLRKIRETLRHDVLRIGGVGRFTNPDQEVLFLRVDSPNLRRVWWKPSYPIKDYGYTPHISLYRGHDAVFADLVADFLRNEKLELRTSRHVLTVHRMHELPFVAEWPPASDSKDWPVGSGCASSSFLPRLQRFVKDYHAGGDGVAARGEGSSVGIDITDRVPYTGGSGH